jgi:PilZ domain
LSARIYPPEPGEIAPNYWIDPRFTYKNLERIFEEDRICGLFKTISDHHGIGISVLAIEPSGLRFKVIPSTDGSHPSITGNRILVTFTDSGKVQFNLNNIRSSNDHSYIGDLPQKIAIVQRRKGFRTPGPGNFDRDLKLLIYFAQGKEMIAQIIDLSEDGLQLDLRANATDMSIGTIWSRCSFERLKNRSEPFDLIIRNTRLGSESSRIRVGCQLLNPSQRNASEFESTRNAIHTARVQRRLKFWFQNVSWCS